LDRQEPPDESPGPPESDPVETGGEEKAAEALGRLGPPGESPEPPESDPVETGREEKAAGPLGRQGLPGESPGPPESDPVETGGEEKAAGPDEKAAGEMEIEEIDRKESIRKKFQREVLAFPARAGLCAYQPAPRDAGDGRPFGRSGANGIQTLLVLRKNRGYFDEQKVRIPEIRYYILPQPSLALGMFRRNLLDLLGGDYQRLPSEDRLNEEEKKALVVVKKALRFDFSQPPLIRETDFAGKTTGPPDGENRYQTLMDILINEKKEVFPCVGSYLVKPRVRSDGWSPMHPGGQPIRYWSFANHEN
ncbi:MAG: hypothetical protein GY859_17505, partial [Desulfobacterales bacterium]|nr:hypothetical protein [Desulfobacterales bacterium]